MKNLNIEELNRVLRDKTPDEIIDWALTLTEERIVTTSFGVYSEVLLSTFLRKDKNIKVIWCDTLFNTPETYGHAINIINKYKLNVHTYVPLKSREYIDSTLGLPGVDDPKHKAFTEIVKLEPFRRALEEHQPKVWFTNIRVRQTELRSKKDILSFSKDGILKISPFYYWTDGDLDRYVEENNLTKNDSYFDVTKVLANRECGIHFQ
ncbi:phosphoadenosine phosphosulfate reductase family protein [Yeosuana sp. MJ-SS3]|uniref:Phosphoadenosine phosphosulfate reductase family protein n=1 Tax=Gilvirhabdus luticola TaxID=3079858 RepID=A0ABU3U5W1_9FLAO|nr:phosphoadenosine phosphosulfate reductase family protein [Yeosuana sp. MJ-SS3]MDU8885799.1 phosphoadenosine phosphosulfate reductase family protein [Yeosuana sp. MJ-SS3]